MADSVTAGDIPPWVDLVAGYIDGTYAWSAADWALFPGKPKVQIAVLWTHNAGHVLDVEEGDATADEAVTWVAMRRAAGLPTPAVYCYSDAGPVGYRIGDVRRACDAAGVARPLFWVAQWDNDPSSFGPTGDPSIVAKQYAHPPDSGGHYDLSIVVDHWPGVDKEEGMASPTFIGQSVTNVNVKVGGVATVYGIWNYPEHGGNRSIALKVYGLTPGIRPVLFYPPADPDADPTEDISAQPAIFVVAVRPADE